MTGVQTCALPILAELQLCTLLEEMGKRKLRARVTGPVGRVPACFVHGYTSLPVTLSLG